MKSAYEIAMEKLRRQDAERGETLPLLTEKQKEEIARIRQHYQAKLAEREILYQAELRKARAAREPEAVRSVEEGYRRDRSRIESDMEEKIRATRLRGL